MVLDLQLMPVWNCCPQILQERSPTPAFLSNFTVTESSWLQKRQGKLVGRGSFYVGHKHRGAKVGHVRKAHLLGSLRLLCCFTFALDKKVAISEMKIEQEI